MMSKVTTRFKPFVPNDVPSQCFDYIDRTNPTIVQIGANNGVVGEEYGFHEFLSELDSYNLFLIEPLKKYYDNLSSVYSKYTSGTKKVTYCNHAITSEDGLLQMIDLGGCSQIINGIGITIKSKSWNSFIADNNIKNIDLIIMDCEGFEFNILQEINFDEISPKVIRYEYAHIPNKEETDNFLMSKGYQISFCETDPPFNKIAVKV